MLIYLFQLQDPEPDEIEEKPVSISEGPEYRHDGYIELVLKVMARMCDGQNHDLQVAGAVKFCAVNVTTTTGLKPLLKDC